MYLFFQSSFLLQCFIFPFISFPFTLFVPHFASLVSLVFPCVIAFLRYFAYKINTAAFLAFVATMPPRRITVSDRKLFGYLISLGLVIINTYNLIYNYYIRLYVLLYTWIFACM